MDLLTRDQLKILLEEPEGPSVSIFMPTYQVGAETQQNPTRLKNLVREAEERLTAFGLRAPEARELLAPAQALIDDGLFWQHQSEGLALFIDPQQTFTYRLPLNFEELVLVANRFHLKPLLSLLTGDGQFYLLTLSQNEIRLLWGSRYHVDEMEPETIPQSLAEALRYDDPEKQLQFHTQTVTPGRQGDRPAIFHGHGVGTDDAKDQIRRYFQKVDQGLQELVRNEQIPLLLAGVDYLLPIYKEVNSYPHLIDEGLEGNPKLLRAEELHERAWSIVEPYFQQAQQQAVERYEQLAQTELATKDMSEIIPAAYYRRIETLFVALDLQQWGRFDQETNTLQLHLEAKPGDEDLLDAAAMQTLLYGGTVYAVEPQYVPGGGLIAAIFRY